jgi:hypothetical protein
VKKFLSRFKASTLSLRLSNKRTIMSFADKMGFVYFGHVDQWNDEHQLIRGLTLSPHHQDRHYSVGSVYDYDIVLAERTDSIRLHGKPSRTYTWLIMAFDLHTKADLPHIFLGPHTHSDATYAQIFTQFGQLQKVPLGTFGAHDKAFIDRYGIYTSPAEALTAERLFDNEITKTIGAHFGNTGVEISDGCLYLYSEHKLITNSLLETILKNGVWLAKHIDERAETI